jgi:long-chain acyl-CoA synthetase
MENELIQGKNDAIPATLPALCLEAIRRHDKPDALNERKGGEWIHTCAADYIARVRHVALGLTTLGIKAGDRVAVLSENRPEWSVTDLAILSLRAVNVPIYTTQAVEQVRFILEDSGARVLFVSGRKVFKHARPGIEGVAALETLVFFDKDAAPDIEQATTLDALEEQGADIDQMDQQAFQRLIDDVRHDDLATIIYTSGTTGEPKGVMLTHDNFVSNVVAISHALPITSDDVALSVLPLSHIFERSASYIFCWNGVSVYYAASFDQVGELLKEVRPTIMTAVPRLFEKVYHKIVKKGTSAGGWKGKLFLWALGVGQRYAELTDKRERIPPLLEIQQNVANALVFAKWREAIGGRLRYFVSGGAALSPGLSYAFQAAGIPILQGYGMTETCIVSANRPDDNRVGSVGLPFPGIDIKIADDGEILIRGGNVMQGYYNHPDATAAVMADGWFHTGDVGRLDHDGHLYITDRKKDLFKLSNGKYVAPQLVESLIKQSEYVSQVIVLGAGRKHPAALIVPDWESLKASVAEADATAPKSHRELSRHSTAIKIVLSEVTLLLKELNDYERVRRIALLHEEFTIDSGELTPTLKVKRSVVDARYRARIDEMYGTA